MIIIIIIIIMIIVVGAYSTRPNFPISEESLKAK